MNSPTHDGRTRTALAFLTFLPMATIGTLVHESGHALAALLLGSLPVLHYGSAEVPGAQPDPEWVFVLGGPLVNMAIGTVGLVWLGRRPTAWLAPLVLALFWSRQPFDLAGMLAFRLLTGRVPTSGDEAWLGEALGIGPWPVAVVTALLGALACGWSVTRVPVVWRVPLVAGGLLGCFTGFAAWYGWIGPWALP